MPFVIWTLLRPRNHVLDRERKGHAGFREIGNFFWSRHAEGGAMWPDATNTVAACYYNYLVSVSLSYCTKCQLLFHTYFTSNIQFQETIFSYTM